jgi:myo-inositol-1(or 4)-monophosphatase
MRDDGVGPEHGARGAVGDPRPVFVAMFEAVRAYLLGEGRAVEARHAVATNPKGETTRAFDAEAERIALDIAREHLGAFRAWSEEAGELQVGEAPVWTLVLDPCDGSNNFRRGIRSVGFAVAALPAGAPLDPDLVEYALCGDIFTGTVYTAARGQGATVDGWPCRATEQTELRRTMLGVNLGHDGPAAAEDLAGAEGERRLARLWELLQTASSVRRSGASVLDLCYVAQGAYSAYVDLRHKLTPENFMAPALIIREAGGMLTGAEGQPLGTVRFTHPYSIIAAGNATLLDALLRALRPD